MNDTTAVTDETTAAAGTAAANPALQRVVQGAHETIDRLADRAAPVVNRVQDSLNGAQEKLGAGAEQMREMGTEWAESMRTSVRANPLTAVGVALALGLLIARVTR